MSLLDELCLKPLIENRRYKIGHGQHTWEVDEFYGGNQGLWLAEIELGSPDEWFEIPSWVGEEVTGDSRYANASLVTKPYSS